MRTKSNRGAWLALVAGVGVVAACSSEPTPPAPTPPESTDPAPTAAPAHASQPLQAEAPPPAAAADRNVAALDLAQGGGELLGPNGLPPGVMPLRPDAKPQGSGLDLGATPSCTPTAFKYWGGPVLGNVKVAAVFW